MSLKKKLLLALMFTGGLITTVAGLLRCILILTSGAAGPQQAGEWSCRESFVAIFVSNVPFIFPVVHRAFRRMAGLRTTTDGDTKSSHQLQSFRSSKKEKKKFKHPLSLPTMNASVSDQNDYERYGSDERLPHMPERAIGRAKHTKSNRDSDSKGDNIQITTDWEVESVHGKMKGPQDFERERTKTMFGQI